MPTYSQNKQTELPVKIEQRKPAPMVRMPAFGPLELGMTVDASSSMEYLRNAVIAGFNVLLSEQKPGSKFSFNTFANSVRFLHRNESVESVNPLCAESYRPSGGTALLDGIGQMINEIGARYDRTQGIRPRVLVAILTDGMENSSHMFGLNQIFTMIHHRRLANNWEFIFLTAGSGGVQYGLKLGIKRSNIIEFDANPETITLLLERLSRAVGAYQLGDRNFARLLLEDKK